MKSFPCLIMAAVLILCTLSTTMAEAIDVRVKGHWQVSLTYMDNQTLHKDGSSYGWGNPDNFNAYQRFRTQIDFIASESLSGTLAFEIGTMPWGGHGFGGVGPRAGAGLDADGVNIKTRRAYIDWLVPSTELAIRMGILPLNLPLANGIWRCNPIMSSDVAGITASYTFNEMLALTAFWVRPFDQNWNDGGQRLEDEMDMFGLMLPITGQGWNVTPYFMYSRIGGASGYAKYQMTYWPSPYVLGDMFYGGDVGSSANAWWAGFAANIDVFDPLSIGLDFIYGRMGKLNFGEGGNMVGGVFVPNGFDGRRGGSGWLAALRVDYKLENMTPGLFAWYTSGDTENKANAAETGRIAVVGMDDGWGISSMGFAGGRGTNSGDCVIGVNPIGTWGVGVQLKDLIFVNDLSHTLRFVYLRGTNEHEVVERFGEFRVGSVGEKIYLTDKDTVLEVNVDTVWQVYENLDVTLELGWMKADMENLGIEDRNLNDDCWKVQVAFGYSF